MSKTGRAANRGVKIGEDIAKAIAKPLSKIGDSILNAVTGIAGGVFGTVMNGMKAAMQELTAFDQMAATSARSIGMSHASSMVYAETLVRRTKDLAVAYGVTKKEIAAVQDALATATGKAIMLSDRQAENAVAINKMIGGSVYSDMQEQMQKFGGGVDQASDAAMESYAAATRMGLSAQKFTAAVASNLKMANEYKFSNGVSGIMKMTALSEKLGFNLQSIGSVADKFGNIEGAIESSANLQVLGGTGAMYGSNPMAMMYESLNDTEALTERMTKMFSGMATFNGKTGTAELSGYNLAMIKAQAEAMGMNSDEAVSVAKNQAKSKFIDKKIGGSLNALTDEQKAYVENKGQYNAKTGKVTLTDASGQERDVTQMSAKEISEMQATDAMTDKDAFISGAQSIVSVNERIEGIVESIKAMFAQLMLPLFQLLTQKFVEWLPAFMNYTAKGISVIAGAVTWLSKNLPTAIGVVIGGLIGSIIPGVGNVVGAALGAAAGGAIGAVIGASSKDKNDNLIKDDGSSNKIANLFGSFKDPLEGKTGQASGNQQYGAGRIYGDSETKSTYHGVSAASSVSSKFNAASSQFKGVGGVSSNASVQTNDSLASHMDGAASKIVSAINRQTKTIGVKSKINKVKGVPEQKADVKGTALSGRTVAFAKGSQNRQSSDTGKSSALDKPLNLNITGTIKIDGGKGNTANIDANKLLKDTTFISQLSSLIHKEMNRKANFGTTPSNYLSYNRPLSHWM